MALQGVNFEEPLRTFWPRIQRRFEIPVPEVAIVDFDEAISGGPLGPYILGIFSSKNIAPEFQALIQATTGWSPQTSTENYIRQHYASFKNPMQAYVDDMIVHELGHLYFGFGINSVPEKETDWWFPVGLGLLYDRLAWEEVYSAPSPLFAGTAEQWSKFAQLKVDQRLIDPDTSHDEKYGLSRRQIYSHAKALEFLKALRKTLGEDSFDASIKNYLRESLGQILQYDEFLMKLQPNDRRQASVVEEKFGIR